MHNNSTTILGKSKMEVATVDYMWVKSGLTSLGFRKRGFGF